MSQDIRVLFGKIPSQQNKTPEAKINTKKKKRLIIDSDSEDDFQSPKSKKNKTSSGKPSRTSPKSNKKVHSKATLSNYVETKKSLINSFFGKSPKSEKNKDNGTNDIKMKDDIDKCASTVIQKVDPDEEFISSGYSSQGTSVSTFVTPPKNVMKSDSLSPSPTKKVKISEPDLFEKESPSPVKGKTQSKTKGVSTSNGLKNSDSIVSKKEVPKEIIFTPVKREAPPVSGLWVDKYKPTTVKQIIGQQGDKSNVNKLLKWLRDWHLNQSGTKKLTKPSPWAKDDSGAYFKAALLSGPPGVGKTTTAHLVCKELEMDMVEFNASDTRSKKLLNQQVGELLSSKSLSPFFIGDDEKVSKRHVLVMDEVDGMAGNEDRGGVQELILLIKNSKVPIICMCNDRNHPKIRSLANYCFDLRFNKPRAEQIKGAMLSVCFKEKLKIKPEVLMDVIVNTNQDIRLVLNHLSMLAASSNNQIKASSKDIKIGPWDVLKKVFSEEDHKSMSIHDKSDLFFNDYSIAPLFVQENYLIVVPHSPNAKSKVGKMSLFAKAAESIANGDLIDRAIRSSSAWSLLPTQAMFSSLIPGEVLEGHMGGQINFPLWLGKNSKKNKMDRLTQEIQSHTRLKTTGSKLDISLDYSKALLEAIVKPLSVDGSAGAEDSLNIMREYSLLREDLDSLAQLSDWNFRPDPFTKLESKVKAAFTRAYNKCPIMSPFAQVAAVKKKGKRNADDGWSSDIDDGEASEPEEDDDNINNDAMIVVKKKTTKEKPAGKSVAENSSAKRSKGSKTGKK